MNYFLAKTDPETYSIDDFERERRTVWNGVTNAQAVRAIREMRPGDRVFIYHSGGASSSSTFALLSIPASCLTSRMLRLMEGGPIYNIEVGRFRISKSRSKGKPVSTTRIPSRPLGRLISGIYDIETAPIATRLLMPRNRRTKSGSTKMDNPGVVVGGGRMLDGTPSASSVSCGVAGVYWAQLRRQSPAGRHPGLQLRLYSQRSALF